MYVTYTFTLDSELKVAAIDVAESLVTECTRLSSLAEVVAVTSKPVKQEKLLTVPVMLTEARAVLV